MTAAERQRYAIRRSRERQAVERAALVAEMDRAVAEVGWTAARPVVMEHLAGYTVSGPHGRWRSTLRKRAGLALLDDLRRLPAQGTLALDPRAAADPTTCNDASNR